MNAACSVAKSLDDVTALAATSVGVITVGSITLEPREGNPSPQWFVTNGFALNSFGMPNLGRHEYARLLPNMVDIAHSSDKFLSLSVAGFSTTEYVQLAELADSSRVDMLELNLGCPNVQVGGKQKPIASFDKTYMSDIIESVSAVTNLPIVLKLSPYSNPAELQSVANMIAKKEKVSAVATCNTFANGYFEKNGAPVIAMGYGGVSGRGMFPIGLGQVRQFRSALPDSIAVIGVGGIESKNDVEQYITAGASAVQVASLIVEHGHSAIDEVTK